MRKRILIVEDHLPTSAALSYLLDREGCEVETVRSGEEALNSVTRALPDAISLDLRLSGALDGYQVLDRLRERPETSRIPVLIVTNMGLQQEIERGKTLKTSGYMVKSEHSIHDIAERLLRVA